MASAVIPAPAPRHFKSVAELDDPLHQYLRSRQGCDAGSLESTPVDYKVGAVFLLFASSWPFPN